MNDNEPVQPWYRQFWPWFIIAVPASAVMLKPDETVVLSWITWPDKATRDKGMQAMMSDPDMSEENNPMPFDGKRLIYGGFEVMLHL